MIHFDGKTIRHTASWFEKDWSIPELLGNSKALDQERLADQNTLIRQLIPLAEKMTTGLSETALLHLDFWKNLDAGRISPRNFAYTVKITDTYQWTLKIDNEGLSYTDISGYYSSVKNKISVQLFSDFWFYGPLMPIPELDTREILLAIIREAFVQKNAKSYDAHFQLFAYPKFVDPPGWEFGDYVASDFVNMREFGVDYGRQNFHDGLVALDFISFEQCLNCPDFAKRALGEAVLKDINKIIVAEGLSGVRRIRAFLEPDVQEPVISEPMPESQQTQTPESPQTPMPLTARERQDRAEALLNSGEFEACTEVLLGLLSENDPDDYWRNYVFNMLFDLRQSKRAQTWIAECLQGSNEIYYKKAVDVLSMWGMYGDKLLKDNSLLKALRWENRVSSTDEFEDARRKVLENLDHPFS